MHAAHPIGDTKFYVVGSNEVFVNLNDKHEGPVQGYEQNRLFGGFGIRLGGHMRAELGYLWRNKDNRSSESQNDHVVSVNLFFDTKGSIAPHPEPAEAHH